jgi:hypothetical protein
VKLGFENNDRLKLCADVPLKTAMHSGLQIALDVGGNTATFTLDEQGRGTNALGRVRLTKPKGSGLTARLTADLMGALSMALSDEGFTASPDAKGESRQVRVTLLLNQTVYQTDRGMLFSARSGQARARAK